MVMCTEVEEGSATVERRASRFPSWWLGSEPAHGGAARASGAPGFRLGDVLSGDAPGFLERQWQPFGE